MLEPVIAHEMAHIRRLDQLWILLANLLRAIHFFNPVAWVAVSRLSRTREQLCDEAVLGQGCISPREYGRSLVEILRLNVCGAAADDGLACLIGRKEGLEMRLRQILSSVGHVRGAGPASRGRPRTAAVLVGLAAAAAFILPIAAVGCNTSDTAAAPAVAQAETPSDSGQARAERVATTLAESSLRSMNGIEDGRNAPRYEPDGPITEPTRLEATPPVYPAEAREQGIQGAVVLDTVIEADGTVSSVTPVEYPDPLLRDAAVDSVSWWRFKPATLDGRPVAVRYVVTVMFRLR
jgi:TonB family protein